MRSNCLSVRLNAQASLSSLNFFSCAGPLRSTFLARISLGPKEADERCARRASRAGTRYCETPCQIHRLCSGAIPSRGATVGLAVKEPVRSAIKEGSVFYYVTSGEDIRRESNDLVHILDKGAADFTVDTSKTRQTIKGFGGTFNEQGWDALSALNDEERDKVIYNIFSPEEANLSYGRIPIGSSDCALERYSLAPEKDDFEMKSFSLDRDKKYLIPYIKAAQAVRPDIVLWGSAWSPPIWMKDNNEYEAGEFIDDLRYYKAYALYLARFAEEYEKEGMPISSVAVQNEPTVVTGYPNGGWKPRQYLTFIRDFCGPLFAERELDTEIMLGTFNESDYDSFARTVLDDPEAKRYVGLVGLQWYGDAQIPHILKNHPGMPIMQTETDCGNWHWEPGFNREKASNDFKYAAYTWGRMRSYLSAGVESYMLWNIVLDQEGKNIDKEMRWPQNSGIIVNTKTKEVIYTPMFRAFEHFSRFIPKGSKYVVTTGSRLSVVSFKDPEGNLVVELLNETKARKSITGKINGIFYEIELPSESFSTLIIKKDSL